MCMLALLLGLYVFAIKWEGRGKGVSLAWDTHIFRKSREKIIWMS